MAEKLLCSDFQRKTLKGDFTETGANVERAQRWQLYLLVYRTLKKTLLFGTKTTRFAFKLIGLQLNDNEGGGVV